MSNDKSAATTHGTEPAEAEPAEHTEPRQPEVQHGKQGQQQPEVQHAGPTGVTVTVQPAPAEPQAPAEGTEEPEGTESPTEAAPRRRRGAEQPEG